MSKYPPLSTALSLVMIVMVGSARSQDGERPPQAGGAAPTVGTGRRWAVVIGVNEYLDPKISSLKCCVADARLVAKRLVERGGYEERNILVMTDDQPRAHMRPLSINIHNHVRDWLTKAEKGDTVLVFFSGHGFLDDRGQGFLATADCRQDNMALTSLRTEDLRDWLQQCKAAQKVLVLDCCHAGGEKGEVPAGPSSQELGLSFRLAEGLITLASCQKDELSQEWAAKGQGLFTYFLAEGLAGGADADKNGIVDSDEIYNYTLEKVRDIGQRELNVKQTPVRIIPEGVVGRFALAKVSADAAAPSTGNRMQTASRTPIKIKLYEGETRKGPLVVGADVEMLLEGSGGEVISVASGKTDTTGAAILQVAASRDELSRSDALFRIRSGGTTTEKRDMGIRSDPRFYEKYPLLIAIPRSEVPREATNTIGMKLVRIEPGSFTMGTTAAHLDRFKADFPSEKLSELADEQPAHKVTLTKPFYLARHEVTVDQFRRFVEEEGYRTTAEGTKQGGNGWDQSQKNFRFDPRFTWRSPGFPQTDNHPVTNVSYLDAEAFCRWLSDREGERLNYRLPTEAEWEFACRAGTTGIFGAGDESEELIKFTNVADSEFRASIGVGWGVKGSDGQAHTAPVGSYDANQFGLHDMAGNVREWCSDYYASEWYQKSFERDPTGPRWDSLPEPRSRVVRGGDWYNSVLDARPAARSRITEPSRSSVIGFRVAATPK